MPQPGRPQTNPPQARVNWQLDARVVAALRRASTKDGVPMKQIVEEAVRAYLTGRNGK